jgi:hypothetical protein
MKTIEWKKIYGALALLVSVGVQAAEPPAIKITGEHLDYYIDSHLAPGRIRGVGLLGIRRYAELFRGELYRFRFRILRRDCPRAVLRHRS